MSRDELLDGKAGPEAQANEILAVVNELLQAAINDVALQAGSSAEEVGASYPYITIGQRGGSTP